ncbi:MAG: hypothetical protein ACOWWM_19980 [Desulfobacterales bacterium]
MDDTAYCRTMGQRLDTWKQRIHSTVRYMDGLTNYQREDAYPLVRSLRRTADEIDGEMTRLDAACPIGWNDDAGGGETRMRLLADTLRALSENTSRPMLPESTAWL